ncbi:DUF87 domain-containing protein [Aliarcobacter cryaerophilus]|uniref:ATP-binding protein n=1 Tax=Aliarcobacter cryaerophilus TaxID=28198 RepID=UPI003DA2BC0E
MNNKLNIGERILSSILFFIIILSTGFYLDNGWDFLTNSSKHLNTLFIASALMLIMGSYITEPYFTKPVDVIAKSFSILLVLIGLSTTSNFLFYDTFLYFILVLLILSVLLVFFQQLKIFEKLSELIYQLVTFIGKPEIIFSLLYLLTLLSFFMKSTTNEFILLFGLWLVLIFKKPVEYFSKFFIYIFKFNKFSLKMIPIGYAVGCENPYLFTVELDYSKNNGKELSKGDLIVLSAQNNKQFIGVVINKKNLLNNSWFSIYILQDENNEPYTLNISLIDNKSIFYSPNQVYLLDLDTLNEDIKQKIKTNYLYKNNSNIIGYVSKDSNINKIRFHLIIDEQDQKHQSIGEGTILKSSIFGKETLYQIIDGVTTEENLQHKDKYGFITVIAKKIGNYDSLKKELNVVKWLPSIYSPIFLQKDFQDVVHDYSTFIGTLPNTNYEIPIKELNSLVTHNTAILGILGIGKSRLTFELIKKVIDNTNTKVLCIDITNQYAKELVTYCSKENILEDLSKEIKDELKTTSKADGSKSNPLEWGNEKIYKTKLQESIKSFYESNKRIFTLNPDWHKVMKARSTYNIEQADDLTIAEKTRIIAEQIFIYAMNLGETEESRFLLVFEEAHSLIPEWNSIANPGDQSASNGTAKVILQGRKYGLGSFVVTQRTANISKSILNQCNTIFALRVFDDTGKQFLENYIGSDYVNVLSTLEERHCIAVGKALKLKQPIILKLNDMDDIINKDVISNVN